jgi:hypothetical protein
MPGLGSNEWFLPTKNGEFLQIRVKCDDPAVEVRDLDLSSLWVAPESHSTDLLLLRGFLQQFHDMNSRLKYHYEPCTEHFITQCAKIQWDMLSKTSLPLSKLPESASFIAMTLRALAYAQKYSSVVYQIDFSEPEHHFSQPKTIQGDNFSIEVWRCLLVPEPVSSQLGQINGEQLSSLIRDIVRITQRVLLKRHPTDWPYLLCVLGLLRVIASDLSAFTIWIDPFSETLFPFQSVLSMLCQMYQICTKGNHPLVDGGTWEGYASIAGNDQLAVAHFRSLKEIWMECLEEGCSHDDFDEKMTYLIFGEK